MEPTSAAQVVKPGRPAGRPSDFDSVLTHVLANIGNAKTLVNLKKSTNSIFDYFAICWEYKQENIKIDTITSLWCSFTLHYTPLYFSPYQG